MKKLLLCAVLSAFFGLTACEKKPVEKDTLTVVTSADYPPFEYFVDGKIVGFEIDVVTEIGKRLGKKIEFKDMSFDAILGALKSGRADMAASCLSATPERIKSVDFSVTFHDDSRVLVCPETSSVKAIMDLVGNVVGVQSGSTHETFAQKELPSLVRDAKSKSLAKIPDLLQDMKAGRISCVMMGSTEAVGVMAQHPGLKSIAVPSDNAGFGIAFPKNSPLTEKVSAIIKAMLADGTMETLKKKWIS